MNPPDDRHALSTAQTLERARAVRKAYESGKASGKASGGGEPQPWRGQRITTAPETSVENEPPTYDDLSESVPSEQAILGGLLLDSNAWDRIVGVCCEADFYRADHRLIYACIGQLIEAGSPADVITVTEALKRAGKLTDAGGLNYVAALAQNTPSALNIRAYAETVRDYAVRRNARGALLEFADRVVSPGADLEQVLRDATEEFERLRPRDGWPAPVDLVALSKHEPKPPAHIVPRWLPQGEVTLFAGHGGAGKSEIALHFGACIALGRLWYGIETAQRNVYFVSCEDGQEILHWRLTRIARHLGVELSDLAERLRVIDASTMDAELMVDIGRSEEPIMTALYTELLRRIPAGSVVIMDGASDLYGASEIVRRHVRRFVRALRRLAASGGAVLLLAHVDKVSARKREATDRYSGSTAWHNSVRARWELTDERESVVLKLAKANHALAGAGIGLRWDAIAHMHLPVDAPADEGIVGSIRERTESEAIFMAIRGCMRADPPIMVPAALTGPRTTWHVLSERPEFPAALKSNERAIRTRFARHLEQLRQAGRIRAESVRNEARKPVGVLVAHEVRES